MASRARDTFFRELDNGLYEPTQKRIRVVLGGLTIVDTTRAMLVWEPRRIVPSYAVPVDEVEADLVPADAEEATAPAPPPSAAPLQKMLHPGIPFAVHTFDGQSLSVRAGGAVAEAAAFRATEAELADHVILDFFAFEAWYEEDERIVGHPRDPFHRIDILHSSRHVRVERDGLLLAESSRPYLLFETNLPARFYLPPEDVRSELLQPSATRTYCAYKGQASYWSLDGGGRSVPDVAWAYEHPLREASEVQGRIAFFNERVDVVVDGERRERPVTPWS